MYNYVVTYTTAEGRTYHVNCGQSYTIALGIARIQLGRGATSAVIEVTKCSEQNTFLLQTTIAKRIIIIGKRRKYMKPELLYPAFAKSWINERTNNVWFYSDPHFADPEMPFIRKDYIGDEEQVQRINSKVGRHDTLVILGDVGDVEFVKKLRGYKILILGNHDAGASNYKRQVIDGVDNHLFDEVYTGVVMITDKIILSHQPIQNLPPFMFNIHGHDHSNWFTGSRHLNLCAEHINYTPVSLTEIIKSGVLKDVESIHRLQIDATVAKKNR